MRDVAPPSGQQPPPAVQLADGRARDYPLDSLADALDTLAGEAAAALPGATEPLHAGAARVRG